MVRLFDELVDEDNRLNTYLEDFERHDLKDPELQKAKERRFMDQAAAFLKELRTAGKHISDPDERRWLAACARRWGTILFEKTGRFHSIGLLSYVPIDFFQVKHEKQPWKEAGSIPVYCIEAGEHVTAKEIDRLAFEAKKRHEGSTYAFLVYENRLTDNALQCLQELKEKDGLVIIPINTAEIRQIIGKSHTSAPGFAYRKLLDFKKRWSA